MQKRRKTGVTDPKRPSRDYPRYLYYKGFHAAVKQIDYERELLMFALVDAADDVEFEADSFSQAKIKLEEVVDKYIKAGGESEYYPGNFLVRCDPELHRQAAVLARQEELSLNKWMGEIMMEAIERRTRRR